MADSNYEGDAVSGQINFAVSGKRLTILCEPCSSKGRTQTADLFCTNCVEYQCCDCSVQHKVFSFARNHSVVAAYKAAEGIVGYDMQGLDQCKLHLETITYFCEDDNKLCCSKCFVLNHRTCNVTEIKEKASTSSSEIVVIKHDLETIKSKTHTVVNRIQNNKEQLTSDTKEIAKKLQNMQDQVNKMFDNFKDRVSNDMALFQEDVLKTMNEIEASCKLSIIDVVKSLIDIENVSQQGTAEQRFIIIQHIKDQLQEIMFLPEEGFAKIPDICVSFDFNDVLKLPPVLNSMPGNLTLKYTVPTDISNEFKNNRARDRNVRLKELATINLKKRDGEEEYPLISGIAFLRDGRLFAVDNANQACLLFNHQMEITSSFKLAYPPKGVVVISDNDVAITSGRDVLDFFHVDKSGEIRLSRSCKVNVSYDSIALIDAENFLVGTLDHPCPVRVVSMTGEENELGFDVIQKTYKLDESSCTYIKNCRKIVLTDSLLHVVYIYDIATKTKVEIKEEKIIKEPFCVAVGPDDSFFVGSFVTGLVVQISHTGQILTSFNTHTDLIRSMTVSKNRKVLAVVCRDRNDWKLKLYDIILT